MGATRTLNGWQRLWVVASLAALLYVTLWAVGQFNRSSYETRPAVVAGFKDSRCRAVVEMPARSTLDLDYEHLCYPLYLYRSIYDDAATTAEGYERHMRNERLMTGAVVGGIAAAMWITGIALLCGLGVVVAWVRRGFTQRSGAA